MSKNNSIGNSSCNGNTNSRINFNSRLLFDVVLALSLFATIITLFSTNSTNSDAAATATSGALAFFKKESSNGATTTTTRTATTTTKTQSNPNSTTVVASSLLSKPINTSATATVSSLVIRPGNTVSVPVVSSAPTPPAPPATTCTAEQRVLVLKQLPNSADCSTQFHSGCSFRVATSGCQNPILARTFFANTHDFKPVASSSSSSIPIPFTAVIVRWGNNNIPLDLLRIGSGLDPKYQQMKEWGKNLNTCRAPITTTIAMKEGEQPPRLPPQVVVLDWDNPTSFSDYGYKAKGLIIEDKIKMNGGEYTGKKDSFTTLIQSKLVVEQQQQPTPPIIIHYLDLVGRAGGYDYMILMELLPALLQHVRFLHFGYNEKDNWSSPSYTLNKLIRHLKTNGLICYWSGDEHSKYGLWRITDCFLDHYNEKNWSRIQCVSGRHADVQELATRMETQFLTTIQRLKNRSIGG